MGNDPYNFSSKKFYKSNSSAVENMQYDASYDISKEVNANSEMSNNVVESDVDTMQYQAGYDLQNEVRSGRSISTTLSETSLGSLTMSEYLNRDKNKCNLSDDTLSDISIQDISIQDSDRSEYKPTREEEMKME